MDKIIPLLEEALSLLTLHIQSGPEKRAALRRALDDLPVRAGWIGADGTDGFHNRLQGDFSFPECDLTDLERLDIYHDFRGASSVTIAARLYGEQRRFLGTGFAGADLEDTETGQNLKKSREEMDMLSDLVSQSRSLTLMALDNKAQTVLFVSGNILQYGLRPDDFYAELVGWLDLVHPDDRPRYLEEMQLYAVSAGQFSQNYRLSLPDGRVLNVCTEMEFVRNQAGEVQYFRGVVYDNTRLHDLRGELNETRRKTGHLLDRSMDEARVSGSQFKLTDLLAPETLQTMLREPAERYGIYVKLAELSGEAVIPEYNPCAACRAPNAHPEAGKCCNHNPGMMQDDKYVILKCPYHGLSYAVAPVYLSEHIAAACHFGMVHIEDGTDAGGTFSDTELAECFGLSGAELREQALQAPRMTEKQFAAVCEAVVLILDGLSELMSLSIRLLQQSEDVRLLRKNALAEHRHFKCLTALIEVIFSGTQRDQAVSDVLETALKELGLSRAFVYDARPDGSYELSYEIHAQGILPLPAGVLRLPSPALPLSGEPFSVGFCQNGLSGRFTSRSGAKTGIYTPVGGSATFPQFILGLEDVFRLSPLLERPDFTDSVLQLIVSALSWKAMKRDLDTFSASITGLMDSVNALLYAADAISGELLFANAGMRELFGLPHNLGGLRSLDLFGSPHADPTFEGVADTDTSFQSEREIGGRWYRTARVLVPWPDGREVFVITMNDITQVKKQQRLIEESTYQDPLLGVYNRRRFELDLNLALRHAAKTPGALLCFDLDDFSYINNACGYETGDAILLRFTRLLSPMLGGRLYRFGGDEFMGLLPGIGQKDLHLLVEDIITALHDEQTRTPGRRFCTASIGAACYPRDGVTVSDLLRSADMALRKSKLGYKGSVWFFRSQTSVPKPLSAQLENALRRDVNDGCRGFTLYYQPLLPVSPDAVRQAECFLHWEPEPGRLLLPEEFIPAAETLGLVPAIGDWVLRSALRDGKRFQAGGADIRVSVNLFQHQIHATRLSETVSRALEEADMPPNRLILEVSEAISLYDARRKNSQLSKLRAMGVTICADDYGRGQSSPLLLKNGYWDMIKLERDFISRFLSDDYMGVFVKTQIKLAKSAGLEICAAGVETDAQKRALTAFGVDYIQGHLVSPPVTADKLGSIR